MDGHLQKATGEHGSNASSDWCMRGAYLMEFRVTWQWGGMPFLLLFTVKCLSIFLPRGQGLPTQLRIPGSISVMTGNWPLWIKAVLVGWTSWFFRASKMIFVPTAIPYGSWRSENTSLSNSSYINQDHGKSDYFHNVTLRVVGQLPHSEQQERNSCLSGKLDHSHCQLVIH